MRRIASFAIPLGCTIASLAVVAACEDDPLPRAADFDAQAPSFDANRPPPPDGSIPDTSVPDVDAGPAPVTVLVKTPNGQPVAGATVVFGAANGDVLQTVTSDATGTAVGLAPSGSQVTVVLATGDNPRLVTITQIEPGDILVTSDLLYGAANDQKGTVSVAANPDAGAGVVSYVFSSGECSTATGAGDPPPYAYGVQAECIGPAGKFPVLTEAFDDSSQVVGFQFAKNNAPLPDAGTVTPTFGAWSTAVTQQTLNATNVSSVDGGGSPVLGYGEIADGVMRERYNYAFVDDGGASVTFTGHTGYPEGAQFEVSSGVFLSGPGDAVVGTATRVAAPNATGTTNVDFNGQLPVITSATVNEADPKRPVVTWVPAGALATADGTYVVAQWYETTDAQQGINGTWAFITPANVTTVTAPKLPASVTALPGVQASFAGAVPKVVAIDATFVNGYGEFRKGAGVVAPRRKLLQGYGGMYVPPLPVNGTVKYTAFTENGD